ncbi:hypothetical protein EV361DRAFT_891876 [Lentinula raphanica]|nr:hypothetical protein EV361DRAFT_891876 [Lentinula raphanica]
MRPNATHFFFTMTTLKLVASMNTEPGKSASNDVSSSGGKPNPQLSLDLAQTPGMSWPRASPHPPPTKPLPPLPPSRESPRPNTQDPPAPQVQEKRGYTEPVGTNYASIIALDSAAVDEDPSDTDSAIIQSAKG